jgi:Arc/MetJ-type ribon-helix-helix transcriptional regulator
MKKKPNFEKVSVSLPPEVSEWLKKEAQSRTQTLGENWSASRIVQEAIREYRARRAASPMHGQAMPDHPRWMMNEPGNATPQDNLIRPSTETSGGGSSTPKTARYQKGGRRKSTT